MNKRFDSELHQFPQKIPDSEKDGLRHEIRLAVKNLCSDSGQTPARKEIWDSKLWKVKVFLVYSGNVFKQRYNLKEWLF